MKHVGNLSCVVLLALLAFAPKVSADDLLKVASPYRGAWETAPPEIGRQAGIFKKHGIVLELVYTRDSDEAEQRVISGSIDVGLGIDAMDALRAYARGDRVRIIGANVTGATSYWYVLKTSPIQTIKDLVGKTIAYATNGSSSHYQALDLINQFRIKAKLVATGSAAATLKELTSNRIDVGWATPPFGIREIEQGNIRVLARANDVLRIRNTTLSVLMTNAGTLEGRKDVLVRFMEAYRETIEWMYSGPTALKSYAEFAGVSEGSARRLRDEFVTREMLSPDQIIGLKVIMKDAKARLSKRQVAELIQIPASVRDGPTGSSSWRRLFSR
jgi:ABC-type nitrate/sulfonate/bicarbonate transport system substrate-binding protein